MKVQADHITVRNGDQVIAEVTKAFANGDHVIDFSSVKQIDSTALAVILAAKRALKSDKTLELQHPPAQLDSLIAAYGVQSLFS
ncbi:STAS domain-containing protein [Limnobacter parvus]|uniref:STAS domain-containing protein n=1 Tax=Limnobacter parvus TaxID=2939690 RepID=A0ABT1XCY2_9BURK|nr:STAS domain-containing protein [Limnobacter parvus]MCR2745136.1 STAS domain-containing protein [Limnobacter parvus]